MGWPGITSQSDLSPLRALMGVPSLITVSVVSHLHGRLVVSLLDDIQNQCRELVEVLVTLNVDEPWTLDKGRYDFPIHVVLNDRRRGFAANHNAAFRRKGGSYFCVMNPDVRLPCNPFPALLECCREREIGCVAPRVLDSSGRIEKSARRFPTLKGLARKALGCESSRADEAIGEGGVFPDWVAGMMMLFPAEAYEAVSGFDEAYYLYYEDVDICARLWGAGFKVALCPRASVVHDARRDSHRNPRYLAWHLASMLRFFGRKWAGYSHCGRGLRR